jgi:hypothetical protein
MGCAPSLVREEAHGLRSEQASIVLNMRRPVSAIGVCLLAFATCAPGFAAAKSQSTRIELRLRPDATLAQESAVARQLAMSPLVSQFRFNPKPVAGTFVATVKLRSGANVLVYDLRQMAGVERAAIVP